MNTTAGSKQLKTSDYTNKDACRGAAAAGRMHLISVIVVGTQGINFNLPHGQQGWSWSIERERERISSNLLLTASCMLGLGLWVPVPSCSHHPHYGGAS